MIDPQAVHDQLAADFASRLAPVLRLDPAENDRADTIAARLASLVTPALCSDDEHEVAQAVIDLASALDLGPATPASWWASPVGRICAASLAGITPSSDRATAAQTADMLGVGLARVYQLRDAGKLDRHPDGGVTLASVYQRLGTIARVAITRRSKYNL